MKHNSLRNLLFVILTLFLSGCMNEDTPLQYEQSAKGRIVLSTAEIEGYTDAGVTRSVQTLSDYTGYIFTLNGTSAIDGHTVNQTVNLAGGPVEVDAGTYTLTVSNESATQTGKGFPTYTGTSDEFTLHVLETEAISIAMGKPSNSKVTVEQTSAFSEKYNNVRVTLTAGGRSVDLGNATGCETEAFFPAGSVSYTISAAARVNSHVTDINSITGSIPVTAGKHHVISLTINSVTGEIVPIISGTHTGEFD